MNSEPQAKVDDLSRASNGMNNLLNSMEIATVFLDNTLKFTEKQVKARDDRWFKVRIMPYRTQDNLIDGVVITFIDISETKKWRGPFAAGPIRPEPVPRP